ncbi:protein SYM1-like isoform X4 [Euphorbia lathyris]|uniref:protein SYM1-like isoform X4 n=1 Tax=Euphorbia lathyris TaxID=212925 RepID=UPI00331314B4
MTFASYVRNITKPSYHTYICRSRQQWSFNFRPHQFIKTRDSNLFLFHSYSTSNSKPKIGFIGWYLGKLESRPIATKTITTSLIYAAADLTAQVFSSSSGSFDLIRTSRMAAYGLLLLGPSQHIWFNFMSKALPKRDVLSTLKKTFLGQAFYGPANAIVFFSYNAALQDFLQKKASINLKATGFYFRFGCAL